MHACIHTYIHMFIHIYKEFCVGGSKAKRCYIVHIVLRGVNSAILFVYRTGYAYGKEPKGFQNIFLSHFSDE